ncbi:hypothetical protein BPO_1651 [Bergeyella porcorum]|uniref:Cardiolipin synthase N-terminal domain-containing protein n=1 Tax=Bergeyella porcorum TaxID=1735111 RepID=A0AAU0F4P1_9FLAO
MGTIFLIVIFALIIANFIWAILNIKKNQPYRLLWHLFICFFPVFGPLIFMANNKK